MKDHQLGFTPRDDLRGFSWRASERRYAEVAADYWGDTVPRHIAAFNGVIHQNPDGTATQKDGTPVPGQKRGYDALNVKSSDIVEKVLDEACAEVWGRREAARLSRHEERELNLRKALAFNEERQAQMRARAQATYAPILKALDKMDREADGHGALGPMPVIMQPRFNYPISDEARRQLAKIIESPDIGQEGVQSASQGVGLPVNEALAVGEGVHQGYASMVEDSRNHSNA